jgi:threonine/homoserine/homoserine lactone efflux protein
MGMTAGFLSGVGAATADAAYGFIAAFGITLITQFMVGQQGLLRFVGGLFLCCLGYKMAKNRISRIERDVNTMDLLHAYLSTFLITLTSPVTIISYAAVFASFGAAYSAKGDILTGALIVLGVFTGSVLWALTLSVSMHFLGNRLTQARLHQVNIASGAVVALFGVASIMGTWL